MTGYAINFGVRTVQCNRGGDRIQNQKRDWVSTLTALGGLSIIGAGTAYLTKQALDAVVYFFSSEYERAEAEWDDANNELLDMKSRRRDLERQLEEVNSLIGPQEERVAALWSTLQEISQAKADAAAETPVDDAGSSYY